ncbi:PLP-dependent aminotransferase family protein [Agarivorans aestuarii]|uniref:PLP-dependent aminotransferase family protein n=1 Tax=Agarivorans aestuarii TaxID=1563703 RepID=A0ABU7G4V9_9ALTE|nr:PLP-dependent aminotransferase family protein [Agarivorans aestuarii]MEE1674315.1 PLP-dependent aminotransferase family protein [Agarivorans aestuarii]
MLTVSSRVQQTKPSYIRNILKVTQQVDMLSLAGGLPDAELFPLDILAQAAAELERSPGIFQYGATEGLAELRQWLLGDKHLSDDVLITTGSQQALDLIARSYLNPRDKVLCEAPSYLGALQVFDLAEAEVHTVMAELDGPNLAQLEQQLAKHKIKLFYAVPDFQNPSGHCWSLSKRKAVASLLAKYKVALIEDAPYRQLRYQGEPLPTVSELSSYAAFYLGSFSKIATPGMRVGYVKANQALLAPLKKVKQASDLHSALPMQMMLLATVRHPLFAEHLTKLTNAYRARRDYLAALLKQQLKGELTFEVPEGGMFIWARLTRHNAILLAEAALQQKVAIVPGDEFWPSNHTADYQAIRLNFTALIEPQLEQAVIRLKKAIQSCSPN